MIPHCKAVGVRHEQEVCIPAEAINLGDDELDAVKPASLTQDGPVRLLPALDLDELFDDLTVAAVQERRRGYFLARLIQAQY